MNKLDELKKQYALLGEEIKKLESEPDGFLGMSKGDNSFLLMDLLSPGDSFLRACSQPFDPIIDGMRGYLNVFKTKEQAEAARYILIDRLDTIKKYLLNGDDLKIVCNHAYDCGKRIAKELGLD